MNNKQKGNSFERDCSRMLSLWWTGGKRDDAIWRSASSGALTTVGKGRYLAHTGDFSATDGEAALLFEHVIIEAKRGYSRYSVQDLLDTPTDRLAKNPVRQMMVRLGEVCFAQHKLGMLLWKRDRRDLLVFLRGQQLPDRRTYRDWPSFDARNSISILIPDGIGPDSYPVYCLRWNCFTTNVSADRLKSLLAPPASSSTQTPTSPAP